MHALIVVYCDSELTAYHTRFRYRYAAAYVMDYIWLDASYRKRFAALNQDHPRDFSAFCNFLINDINKLLFDGLLALEIVKEFEDLRDDEQAWDALTKEQQE